jgi:FkbM family methyltransferase
MFVRRFLRTVGHAQWLRYGLRYRLIRAFDSPQAHTSEPFEVPFYGMRYRGNFNTMLDWHVYYFGAYERSELQFLHDCLSCMQSPVFVDVGANIGHHTLSVASRVRRVLAFEPFQEVLVKFREKVHLNGLCNVLLFEHALGEQTETRHFFKPWDHNTGTGSFVAGEGGAEIELPIVRGDEALRMAGSVHLIKIDTEGFEPEVLRGLQSTLNRDRPVVFFEWSGNERQMWVNTETLLPKGYRVFKFVPDLNWWGLFRRQGYGLRELRPNASWPDGNLVAMSDDFARVFLSGDTRGLVMPPERLVA